MIVMDITTSDAVIQSWLPLLRLMHPNSALENIFGTIGTVLWTGQLIPQVYKSWKNKTTLGLSPWLMFIWAVSGAFLGVYAIVQNINVPIIVQPQVFSMLAAFSWIQCLYYDPKRSKKLCAGIFLCFGVVFASFEVAMVYATRAAMKHGDKKFLHFFGVFSGVLICLALIPQFIEIYRLGEVRGVSLLFLTIDISGGVFSMLSLGFKTHMDWIAAVTYLGVIILDGAIIVLAFILNPIANRRRRAQVVSIGDHSITSPSNATAVYVQQQPEHAGQSFVEKEKGGVVAL